jgi:hypothetical protein
MANRDIFLRNRKPISGQTLRGCRGVIVAIAGLALAGAQQPTKQAEIAKNHQPTQETTNSSVPQPKSVELSYSPYADRSSDSCYNAKSHDTADLCAQWRAAIAAEKAASEARNATIAAFIGVFLSFMTVVGLMVTIFQTRGALGEAKRGNQLAFDFELRSREEARRAAEDQERALAIAERNAKTARKGVGESAKATGAMIKANEIARNAQRAWVAIKGPILKPAQNGTAFCPEITNVGGAPALDVRTTAIFESNSVGQPNTILQKIDGLDRVLLIAPPAAIAPGIGFEGPESFVSDEHLLLVLQGQRHFFAYYHCRYKSGGEDIERTSCVMMKMVFPCNMNFPPAELRNVVQFEIFGNYAKIT